MKRIEIVLPPSYGTGIFGYNFFNLVNFVSLWILETTSSMLNYLELIVMMISFTSCDENVAVSFVRNYCFM